MTEFVFLYRSSEDDYRRAMGTPELAQKSLERYLAWIKGLEKSGTLTEVGKPLERSGKVVRGPDSVVTDGPFTEAKDLILGFIVIEARDLEHATAIAATCPIALGGGAVEVRPVAKL
ncbi:MAG: YciI family protein [Polyangiaceae bacterium]